LAIVISRFDSVSSFTKYVEQMVQETKSALGAHMAEIEEIRKKYDKAKKRYDVMKKLTGGKADVLKDTKQTEVAGFKVLVSPSAEYELTLMEEAITSIQEKLDAFERTKELFPMLTEENMRIAAVVNDGIPTGFMFYVAE